MFPKFEESNVTKPKKKINFSAEFGVFEADGLFVSSSQEPVREVRVHLGRESMCEISQTKPNYIGIRIV